MFIGVSMQLRELSEVSSDPILLVGCTCKKKKKSLPPSPIFSNFSDDKQVINLIRPDHVLLRFSSTGLSALSLVLRSLLNRLMQQFLS